MEDKERAGKLKLDEDVDLLALHDEDIY